MSVKLPIEIDRTSGFPFYVQLGEQISLLVRRGALKPGDCMPTVRTLAVDLGVNANTVARVYRDLQRQGLLRLERGVGTFVSDATEGRAVEERDFKAIADEAAKLVELSRRAGLSAGELAQLVESLYREQSHVEG